MKRIPTVNAERPVWLAAGLRTPFTRVDRGLTKRDAIGLGVPVLQAMAGQVEKGARIDFAVWGSVIPNLGYSNIARESWLDAKLDPTVPATSNVMACVTSITAAMEAAAIVGRANADLALVGGSESMTHIQVGLYPAALRLAAARETGSRLEAPCLRHLRAANARREATRSRYP